MQTAPLSFIGIDPTGSRSPFTYAVLDAEGKLLLLGTGELSDVMGVVVEQGTAIVAVNAPPRPNLGIVRQRFEKQTDGDSKHLRGADLRLAEHILKSHGINLASTPGRKELCPPWMQSGFLFFEALRQLGYQPYPSEETAKQWLETHPNAVFCAMLEHAPMPKPTLEGRLQRQLVLHEAGLGINDPMDFFEEITRHKIMGGNLPMEYVYQSDELDALAAASVAFFAIVQPEKVTVIGDESEGRIYLPCENLKDKY